MPLALRSVARATEPHGPALAAALAPLLAVANAGSFQLRYQSGKVIIEQGSFAGCDLAAIDAAVAAAPVVTDALNAKADLDDWPKPLKALVRLIVKELNRLRQNPSTAFAAFTEQQVIDAIKTEIDGL